MKSELIFQSSPFYVILCLLVGGAYTFFLYQQKKPFSTLQHRILAISRGLLVSLICFLLLNPLVKSTKTTTEKPMVVLAIDNSSSLAIVGKDKFATLKQSLAKLIQSIEEKGSSVAIQSFDSPIPTLDSLRLNAKQSNLSQLLANIKNDYEGRNLSDVILVSDGIVNAGVSPTYGQYNFNIHTVGIGDTTLKKDVKINAIIANKIAYTGNKFPIQVEISSYGFQGKSTTALLKQNGQVLDKQVVSFNKNDDSKTITFLATAKEKGTQRYSIEIAPLSGEYSAKNNMREVYIDIVDGKEKILLLAYSPHPDIKAIKAIIEKNDLYTLEVGIIQNGTNPNEILAKPFDVLILHQIPDNNALSGSILPQLLAKKKPVLFIVGNQSNLAFLNASQQAVAINSISGRGDKVSARFNNNFNLFNLDSDKLHLLEKLPPMEVPYGDIRTLTGSEIVLFQKVGTVATEKPLLLVNTTKAPKVSVLLGEGLWQWRLEEYSLSDKQEVVDDLLLKTVQLISEKDDKRKLRVYPLNPEIGLGEKVIFENEAYNDIYERIYDQAFVLAIVDEKGKVINYNYSTSKENTHFEISDLPEGVYRYKASTMVLNKREELTGQFVIKNTNLEDINTTADFDLLRTLAKQNNGKFFTDSDLSNLNNILGTHKSKVSYIEEFLELINKKWLFFLIIFLASAEWVSRKYWGTY